MMILFWSAVFALLLWGISSARAPRSEAPSALDILEQRFAAGEIEQQEFEERRRVLKSGS